MTGVFLHFYEKVTVRKYAQFACTIANCTIWHTVNIKIHWSDIELFDSVVFRICS